MATSLMNILPSPTKFQPSPKPAVTILDTFVVSVLTSILPQLPPLPPRSFTPNSITVILSTTTYLSLRITRLQLTQNSLTRAVVKALKSCHITPVLRCLHWLKITERIAYKLLSLTYNVVTTTQPPYLHSLFISGYPRSTTNIILATCN